MADLRSKAEYFYFGMMASTNKRFFEWWEGFVPEGVSDGVGDEMVISWLESEFAAGKTKGDIKREQGWTR